MLNEAFGKTETQRTAAQENVADVLHNHRVSDILTTKSQLLLLLQRG